MRLERFPQQHHSPFNANDMHLAHLKLETPSIVSGYVLPFALQGKNNLARQNNLGNVRSKLALKGISGGSLTITLLQIKEPAG